MKQPYKVDGQILQNFEVLELSTEQLVNSKNLPSPNSFPYIVLTLLKNTKKEKTTSKRKPILQTTSQNKAPP